MVLVILALTAAANGQPSEMVLGPDGRWTTVERPAPTGDAKVMADARALLAEGKFRQARRLLDDWIDKNELEESPYLAEAYLLRADAKTAYGREYRALYDYEKVINEYAATSEYVRAVERELEIGIRYLNGLRRHFLGLRLTNAEDVGEELLVRTAERMPRSRLGERAILELADYYYRARELKMAAMCYEIFVQLYPRSEHAPRARQQRIFARIGTFKGPNYDAAGLADARVLIEEYAKDDPIGARRANLTDALLAKLDESMAQQALEKARFYLRRDDPVSARLTLWRLIQDHPRSIAKVEAEALLKEKGWSTQPPTRPGVAP
jgi:hypothetical protein